MLMEPAGVLLLNAGPCSTKVTGSARTEAADSSKHVAIAATRITNRRDTSRLKI
jgi:hypothetical protein